MNIMHKLAEDAIGTILAGSDDWIDDNQYHDFEGDYDWSDDDICTLYFRVDGKYIGSWDIDIAEIEDINTLDNISAEVEAAVSGMNIGNSVVEENWQDDWVEPTIDPNPVDNVNGLDIYKGTDQYGYEAYYLFLEDEDPEPGYEEWQTETLELAREWASSYETMEADDFDDLYEYLTPGNIIRESYSKGIPSEILDMIKDSKRVRNAFIEIGLDPSKMIIDKVDKFHKNNPNYLPVEVYEYNLDDKYSDRSIYGGVGIKIGGYKDIYDSMPGAYVKKTKTIGIYEIDITKNIENNAIIGDKIELRTTNKNDPKNRYLDRVSDRDPTIDKTIDKSGYFTVGNFKSKYGKDALTRRHDIMKAESVEADDFDDEVEPNAYNYIFKALDKSYWDGFDWSDVEYYDNKPCKVIDTSVVLHDFKSSYHDIEFKDGTVLSAISGMHLYPVKTETNDRKIEREATTNNFKSRDALIDEIEKYYNKPGYIGDLSQNYKGLNMEWYEFVEKEIKKITGKSIESLPDNDPDEGFYSNLSTSELIEVLNDINNIIDNLTKDSKVTVELTNQELNLIKTAMEMWSNTNFSKSREESDVAKDILNKLK